MDATFFTNPVPSEIILSQDRLALTLAWEASESAVLGSETARLACRCAWCTRDRILGQFPARFEGIAITNVVPVGTHALHIAFSDGHARGIFPWPYLRDVAHGVDVFATPSPAASSSVPAAALERDRRVP